MKNISAEFTGKTSQEAIDEGLKALGISREEADIEIVEEAKKGFFGIGATKARVKIQKKEQKQEEEKQEIVSSEEEQKETEPTKSDTERTAEFLRGLFDILNIDAKIGEISEGEKIVVNLETDHYNSLIGKKGEIIDAVQTLAGAVANIGKEEYKRVVVDCHNYRENREEKLQNLARKLAGKAIALGKKMKLDAMNPYERRIIHSTLSDNPDVKTQSEGKEPNRYVVIIPNNLKPYDRRNNGRKPYNKDGRGYDKERKSSFEKSGFERSGEGRPYEKKPYNKNKKYDKNRKNYSEKASSGGTGTGSYVKKETYKRNYSSFVGTYLGNSRTVSSEENKEKSDE